MGQLATIVPLICAVRSEAKNTIGDQTFSFNLTYRSHRLAISRCSRLPARLPRLVSVIKRDHPQAAELYTDTRICSILLYVEWGLYE